MLPPTVVIDIRDVESISPGKIIVLNGPYYEPYLSSHAFQRRFLFRFDQRKNLHCLRSIVQTQLVQEIWKKSRILQQSVVRGQTGGTRARR